MAEALAKEFPDLHIQTHVAKTSPRSPIANELFPNFGDYVGIYEKFHLLGPKTLLGHCIHLSHRETEVLAETRSVAVFCPTSNLFIGSGLFDYERQHSMASGSPRRPMSAAAVRIRCCGPWTRATR